MGNPSKHDTDPSQSTHKSPPRQSPPKSTPQHDERRRSGDAPRPSDHRKDQGKRLGDDPAKEGPPNESLPEGSAGPRDGGGVS